MSASERAVEIANERGHTVEWDTPAAITAVRRWTCTACGATILDYHGTIYGSARDKECPAVAGVPSAEGPGTALRGVQAGPELLDESVRLDGGA